MLPAFVLTLREGLEAALVIGIAIGVLRKMKRAEFIPSIWAGAAAAALLSLLAAFVLNLIGAEFSGRGEEIFEGTAMLLAAGLLTWMIFWMRRQARFMRSEIEAGVRKAVGATGKRAMFALAFLAVAREGFELALFLFAAKASTSAAQTIGGAAAGLAGAALFGYLFFTSTRRLSLKTFFQVTNVLLILFAAGLVANSVAEFNEAGVLPEVIGQVWNTRPILSDESAFGELLKALVGYHDAPSLAQLIGYAAYYVLIFLGFRLSRDPAPAPVKNAS
jgi:high-affinity iron transporter